MKPRTLVIIDMQPDFSASNDPKTIRHVLRQINIAKRHGWGIIIVEYKGHTPSHDCITDAVADYVRLTTTKKSIDNGCRVVLNAAAKHGYERSLFRVCGVNINACVRETVYSLAKKAVVEVMKHACNGTVPHWESYHFKHKNVQLVPRKS